MPLASSALFFIPGESITWKVSLGGIKGGRARLAVGPLTHTNGKRVVVLRAEAESAGLLEIVKQLRDTILSVIAVDDRVPTRSEFESNVGERFHVVHAARVVGEPRTTLTVWRSGRKPGDEPRPRLQPLPGADTQDLLSTLLLLRGWRAPPGSRAVAYTLGGERVWRNEFTLEGPVEIDTELGARRTIKLSAVSTRMDSVTLTDDKTRPPRHWSMWLSDDELHLPLLMRAHTELGDIVVEVTSYEAP